MGTPKKLNWHSGIYLALAAALISGISIYVNKFALTAVSDPILFTTLKNTVVGLALLAWLAARARRGSALEPRARQDAGVRPRSLALGLIALAVVGGSVPFLLFFKGLAIASAPSAALIQKSLFLWVALLAAPLLHEQLGKWTYVGLGLLALGQLLNGWPNGWGWGWGETLILAATLLWAVETILAKHLLPHLSTPLGATARMAGGAVVMWLYVLLLGASRSALTLSLAQWGWVLLTSALLLAYVTSWYAALKYAPATAVTGVLTLGAVITVLLNLVIEGKVAGLLPWLGLVVMVLGVGLLIGGYVRGSKRVGPVYA